MFCTYPVQPWAVPCDVGEHADERREEWERFGRGSPGFSADVGNGTSTRMLVRMDSAFYARGPVHAALAGGAAV